MVDQLSFSKRFRAEDTHLWCFVLKYIPSYHLRGHLNSICLSLQMDDECSRWERWKGIPVLSCRHYVAQWSLIFCCSTRHLILIGRLLCASGYSIRGQEINGWKKQWHHHREGNVEWQSLEIAWLCFCEHVKVWCDGYRPSASYHL